jgi:hypothetical protein
MLKTLPEEQTTMAVTKKSLIGKNPSKSTGKPTESKAHASKLANTKQTASKVVAAQVVAAQILSTLKY